MVVPLEYGLVHLWDLPEDLILVGLKAGYKLSMFNVLNRHFNALFNKNERYLLYNLKDNQKIKLSLLWKFSEMLSKLGFKYFSKKEIEKNVEIIGTKRGNTYIFNPKLPFNFNSEAGSYFISAVLFDGGIDRQYKPHYGNIPFKQRKRIVDCVVQIFGDLRNKESNPRRGYMVRFPKTIGILLNHCFKIGVGNKMYANNKVPEFVHKFPNKLKGVFLRQAFDDEGSVSVDRKLILIVGAIDVRREDFNSDVTIKHYNLLNDIKRLLLDLNIESNPIRISSRRYYNKEYHKSGDYYRHIFTFSISGRRNLNSFYNLVGFNLDYKKDGLKDMLDSYKMWQLRKGEIHTIAVLEAKKLQNISGYFDNLSLSKVIKRPYRQTVRITDKLLKDEKVKVLKEAISIGRGWIPRKFVLT